jgi:hypothetical protein
MHRWKDEEKIRKKGGGFVFDLEDFTSDVYITMADVVNRNYLLWLITTAKK